MSDAGAETTAADGTRLYYEVHGSGVPLVLSNGYVTTHENWRGQVAPLALAGARVILWDYRGHGRSGVPADASSYTIDHVVDDLGRVLDAAVPGETAILGGLSFGGLCSLHFAHRHPERVRALLLVDSGPGFKNPKALAGWQEMVERIAKRLEARGFEGYTAGKSGTNSIGRRPELPAARAAAVAIEAQDPQGVAHFGRGVAGPAPPIIDELPEITVPALVVVGEQDADYLRAADVMAAKLANAEKVVVPKAGHVVNIEEAEAFDAVASAFVRRIAGA